MGILTADLPYHFGKHQSGVKDSYYNTSDDSDLSFDDSSDSEEELTSRNYVSETAPYLVDVI